MLLPAAFLDLTIKDIDARYRSFFTLHKRIFIMKHLTYLFTLVFSMITGLMLPLPATPTLFPHPTPNTPACARPKN
jgi:hypothetical protein